jgi:phosphate transport system protein
MARDSFDAALDGLHADVLAFGDAVTTRLRRALSAVDTFDPDLAQSVIDGDAEINERYLGLESDCIDLFALQQPVAADLRLVTACFKILTDLERIADLATNLAALAQTLVDDVDNDTFAAVPLVEIGELALEMLDDALYAFEQRDAALCRQVVTRDDSLNTRCGDATHTIVRKLVEYTPQSSTAFGVTPDAVRQVLVLVRDIERVGDHAVNIAARTYYMLESDDALLY